MTPEQPHLGEKIAYFSLMKELGNSSDDLDAQEQLDRHHRMRFFTKDGGLQRQGQQQHLLWRDASKTATPVTRAIQQTRRHTRTDELVDLTADDTVIPETVRVSKFHRGSRNSNNTRFSLPAASNTATTATATATTESPSLHVRNGMKRKREALKLRPEDEQIFKGLSFYYIPNNDIAPARRLRINKSREYGAVWAREDALAATHVVVDKEIDFSAVEKILGTGQKQQQQQQQEKEVRVVNEDYPIDCIRFRSMLDHKQKKYQVPGQPLPQQQQQQQVAHEEVTTGCEESAKSLQLKPQHGDTRRWDYVPRLGTPLRSVESSVSAKGTAQVDSQLVSLDVGRAASNLDTIIPSGERTAQEVHEEVQEEELHGKDAEYVDDELSQCVTMMQEFKDLPLDNDDDDDSRSMTEPIEIPSDPDERDPSEDEQEKQKPGRKGGRFEDLFACNQSGAQDAKSTNPNSRTIEVLQSMANYYDRISDHWRTLGYRKAITTLRRQDTKISTEEEAYRLPHIGRRIAQKIEEIVTTAKLRRLEYAEDEDDGALQLFLRIYGVGNKQAQQWVSQGHRTLDDLKTSAKTKLNPSQRIGIDHFDDLNTMIPRREVEALGVVVRTAAAQIDPLAELIIGGSYRRGASSSGDVDFIVTKPEVSVSRLRVFLAELIRVLTNNGFLTAHLASFHTQGDGSKFHGCCVLPKTKGIHDDDDDKYRPIWRRVDFLLVPETELGAALIYFTGNDIFNRSIRLLASKKGMRLNQRGLYKNVLRGPDRSKLSEGELVEGRSERKIFEILGVKWREPHERWC
ncbi:hypothetical protein QQS21_006382 [Conoideocrella luteorostrata]|uniref:DNA polymerase lambda n=1 Tax=Conoideocrella luteorostrata TaxID=1105319 RepID=A0AAJ0CQF1_9HYPO|nr:hypothetical protein QQS21_006382 [Conoideocrella luteorostrata]